MKGLFPKKQSLLNRAVPKLAGNAEEEVETMQPFNREINRRKVILVLVDALREDFVEMGCSGE
jgi:hypothetical protein